MTEENYDYELDTKIDKYKLDSELEKQHSLFHKYAKLAAAAQKLRDEKHEDVKTIRSEIIKKLKEEDSKITGQLIEAGYRTDDDYKDAKQELIDAEFNFNELNGSVMSLHQRKASLGWLVPLFLADYYSEAGSSIDRDTRKSLKKRNQEDAKKTIKRKSRRTRKSK